MTAMRVLGAMRLHAQPSLLLAIVVTACEATTGAAPTGLRDRMHQQFGSAKAIQLAIGAGDLDRAREEARRIRALDDSGVSPQWRPYYDDIRLHAAQVVASTDTVTAAKTMAELGRSCGKCHEATHAKIVFPEEPQPPASPKLGSQMASHEWAAARMWEGLIGPASDRWAAGARALIAARFTIIAESGEIGVADDAARARLLARRALAVEGGDERAALYGQLLATCAHCHAAIRDRTLPPPEAASVER